MKRKTVGVLLAQLDETTPSLFMEGFVEKMFSYQYDVLVFSMYQKYQETPLREQGDSNIFELVNFDLLDAVVVMLDTLQTEGLADRIQEKIRDSFSGPVLIIDKESDYFESLMIDHYTPIVKLIDHLIEVHHYKNIVFLNGKKGHIHSKERLRGYLDSMKAHDLPVTEHQIFYGDYWYKSGEPMVEKLLKDPEHLPDAIACANDCMAIGVCDALTKNGIKIPEDIAVIGYDSIEDGRLSPVPLTSAQIPARQCGTYAAMRIHAMLTGEMIDDTFHTVPELFIGGSCGCPYSTLPTKSLCRDVWETDLSSVGYYSVFNHIMDDLLSQDNYQDFFNTVFQYIYQIRDFESFDICLNNTWDKPHNALIEYAVRNGYTPQMSHVIHCGPDSDSGNELNFSKTFSTDLILPEYHEPCDHPRAFIFTPLFFEDRCFGYVAVNYGDKKFSYNAEYRLWIRSIMHGLEALRRQEALRYILKQMEASQIRDALTGLYNYRGFITQMGDLINRSHNDAKKAVLITSVDLSALRDINAKYGREEGNRAITALAQRISECALDHEICARMGNDDFLIGTFTEPFNTERSDDFVSALEEKLLAFNEANTDSFAISICTANKAELITNTEQLEHLINDVVSLKNGRKLEEQRLKNQAELSEEDKKQDDLVADILDHNKFIYYFQPIVSAKNGEIFSYEALMRADIAEHISPLAILDSAKRMNRLYDVEKSTFYNVLHYMKEHQHLFEGKKVFINSIPGAQLTGQDLPMLHSLLKEQDGHIVVELTEQEELDDKQLEHIKKTFQKLHIETALDDYGSGYSNINNLLRYMPSYVKIDRMLMTEIQDNQQKQHFVKNIIEFAHDNDIMALAEGIETSEELKAVIELGVDLIQGYYTAKPHPEPLLSLRREQINEIIQYTALSTKRTLKKRYVVKQPATVPLVQLSVNKFTEIHVKRSASSKTDPISIVGAAGFQSNIKLWFEDGYEGTVILESAGLSEATGLPSIDLGSEVNVTLVLVGDSELFNGGIRVPESSMLTVEGDGNLSITVNANKHFGIGESMENHHGPIYFNQDGGITITANGGTGVGIGSGYGGNITINKGWYRISMYGQHSVGIGAFYGKADIHIRHCDLEANLSVGCGCLIGSYENDANIEISNGLLQLSSSAACDDMIGIGSLYGKKATIELQKANIRIKLRAATCYAIGSHYGDVTLSLQQIALNVDAIGHNAYSLGNDNKTAKATCVNCDLIINITNEDTTDLRIDKTNLEFINGSLSRTVNGVELDRE